MNQVYCTLYNSNYLDKGLVLYDSLCECAKDFKLYVLCMDDKCYEVLTDLRQDRLIPIRLSDFETCNDEQLIKVKQNRTFGEYCWTCTPSLILYVIEKFKESVCTYIDADMYFYHDPQILIDEMDEEGKTVMVTPHRFSDDNINSEVNGIYCVEFNTFVKETNSLELLKKWRQDCFDCCTSINDGVHFGDQKYLDNWPNDYSEFVHVCQNVGAGIAPWNIERYRGDSQNCFSVYYNNTPLLHPIIFYHFQHMTYIDRNNVKTSILSGKDNVDYDLLKRLYTDYLYKIERKKRMLESTYDISYLMTKHPAVKTVYNWKTWLLQFGIVRYFYNYYRPAKNQYVVSIPYFFN